MSFLPSVDHATTSAPPPRDVELLALQLRVARRADELARTARDACWPAVWAWIQAEREILSAAHLEPVVA